MLGLLLGARSGYTSLSAQAGAQPPGAGTSLGGGSSCPTPEQDPAGRGETEAPAASPSSSRSSRAGFHPGSPGGFPPADRARRIPARRRTGKRLRAPPP